MILFFFGNPSAFADSHSVRVGVYENKPKVFISETGAPAGIFIDIIEQIAKSEGWKLHYVPGTWSQGLERLSKGEIDLMPDVALTADRERLYAFHRVPVLSSWSQVYGPKGSDMKSMLDLNGKRVLVLEHSVQQATFNRLTNGFGLTITLIPVPDFKTMFEMLAKGEADAAVTNRFYGLTHARTYGLVDTAIMFEPASLFFAAPKSASRSLLDAIDRHVTDMKKDPRSPYYASLKRWTSEEVRFKLPAWIKVLGLIVVMALLMSAAGSFVLKRRVNIRTRELQAARQRFEDIIEFLPDATFVVDQDKKIIAWNQACEKITGVEKGAMLGQDDYAYAEPFLGERLPMLIDLLDRQIPEEGSAFTSIKREGDRLYSEAFFPRLNNGRGAYIQGSASPLYDHDGRRCGAIETIRDITDQKGIEDALIASEREYRELVMLANSIILRWAYDGRITFLNLFGQQFFGYSESEIIGRNVVGTIVPEKESTGRDLRKLMDEIIADPLHFEHNINENIRRDGERVWIEWTNKIVFDDQGHIREILSVGSDITARKKAEDEARLSATLTHYLSKYANDFIILLDENFRFLEVNERTVDFYGYTREEMIGMHATQLRVSETKNAFTKQIDLAQTSGKALYETLHQRKDGTIFPVEINLRAIEIEGRKFYQAVIRDITERKQAEEQVSRLNQDLRRYAEVLEQRVAERTAELVVAKERAEAADKIKSAFLATMSHELRTPLNSIIGFTGIMLQGLAGPLNEEQHKQMTMVQNSSRHLLSLINDVLDISKIESGQLTLTASPFDLKPSIEKMVKLVAPLAVQKGIDLRSEISEDIGMIVTDQRRVEQVILNLVNNAVKFTENGYVLITCRNGGDHYLLSVTDTGIGMQPQELSEIFQPFHQIDTGLARTHEGTGLGLSICKKLLDMMGGCIAVESSFGKGSTFTIRLPKTKEDLS